MPVKFKDGSFCVGCETVGDVINALSELDPSLPVSQGFSDGCDVVVFNSDKENPHVGFEEFEEWSWEKNQ